MFAGEDSCMPACTAAAEVLRGIKDPVDHDVLESALGQAFSALRVTDWESLGVVFPT